MRWTSLSQVRIKLLVQGLIFELCTKRTKYTCWYNLRKNLGLEVFCSIFMLHVKPGRKRSVECWITMSKKYCTPYSCILFHKILTNNIIINIHCYNVVWCAWTVSIFLKLIPDTWYTEPQVGVKFVSFIGHFAEWADVELTKPPHAHWTKYEATKHFLWKITDHEAGKADDEARLL